MKFIEMAKINYSVMRCAFKSVFDILLSYTACDDILLPCGHFTFMCVLVKNACMLFDIVTNPHTAVCDVQCLVVSHPSASRHRCLSTVDSDCPSPI